MLSLPIGGFKNKKIQTNELEVVSIIDNSIIGKIEVGMENHRKMAAEMNQLMEQLETEGIHNATGIMDRMIGHILKLHQILCSATDQQLLSLSNDFPAFHRYAAIMKEEFEKERSKNSHLYDGMQEFSELHKKLLKEILTTAAAIECQFHLILNTQPKNRSWTGSSARFSAPMARRDNAATCMLQGGATQSSGAEKCAIEPVALPPNW